MCISWFSFVQLPSPYPPMMARALYQFSPCHVTLPFHLDSSQTSNPCVWIVIAILCASELLHLESALMAWGLGADCLNLASPLPAQHYHSRKLSCWKPNLATCSFSGIFGFNLKISYLDVLQILIRKLSSLVESHLSITLEAAYLECCLEVRNSGEDSMKISAGV